MKSKEVKEIMYEFINNTKLKYLDTDSTLSLVVFLLISIL